MTHPILKTSLTISAALAFGCGLFIGCTTTSLAVKVYRLRNSYQALHRTSNGAEEFIPFVNAEGWYCQSPDDEKAIVTELSLCRQMCPHQ